LPAWLKLAGAKHETPGKNWRSLSGVGLLAARAGAQTFEALAQREEEIRAGEKKK
jgi:hypothetical protein